jgi:AcrR family transcriptional regulator
LTAPDERVQSPVASEGTPTVHPGDAPTTWAERAADRSPVVQRSRNKGVEQAKAIVRAARNLIDAKGPSFTTQELIKEAGIALQTFYRYFPGKDHLLLAVIEDVIDENCQAYQERARNLPDPVDRLKLYITATVEGLQGPHNGPSFITSEHFRLQTLYPADVSRATQPFTDLLLTEIREAVDAGRINPRDPEYSAWLMTQLAMAVFHHYDCAGLDEPATRIAERLWNFCLAALSDGGPVPARRTRRATTTKKAP